MSYISPRTRERNRARSAALKVSGGEAPTVVGHTEVARGRGAAILSQLAGPGALDGLPLHPLTGHTGHGTQPGGFYDGVAANVHGRRARRDNRQVHRAAYGDHVTSAFLASADPETLTRAKAEFEARRRRYRVGAKVAGSVDEDQVFGGVLGLSSVSSGGGGGGGGGSSIGSNVGSPHGSSLGGGGGGRFGDDDDYYYGGGVDDGALVMGQGGDPSVADTQQAGLQVAMMLARSPEKRSEREAEERRELAEYAYRRRHSKDGAVLQEAAERARREHAQRQREQLEQTRRLQQERRQQELAAEQREQMRRLKEAQQQQQQQRHHSVTTGPAEGVVGYFGAGYWGPGGEPGRTNGTGGEGGGGGRLNQLRGGGEEGHESGGVGAMSPNTRDRLSTDGQGLWGQGADPSSPHTLQKGQEQQHHHRVKVHRSGSVDISVGPDGLFGGVLGPGGATAVSASGPGEQEFVAGGAGGGGGNQEESALEEAKREYQFQHYVRLQQQREDEEEKADLLRRQQQHQHWDLSTTASTISPPGPTTDPPTPDFGSRNGNGNGASRHPTQQAPPPPAPPEEPPVGGGVFLQSRVPPPSSSSSFSASSSSGLMQDHPPRCSCDEQAADPLHRCFVHPVNMPGGRHRGASLIAEGHILPSMLRR